MYCVCLSSPSLWTVNLSSWMRSVTDETRGKVNLGYHTEDVTSKSTKIHLRTEHPVKCCVVKKYMGDYVYFM